MLQYKNHRLCWEDLSFEIPDGFFLNSTPELVQDNAVHLKSADLSISVGVQIDTTKLSPIEDLTTVLNEIGAVVITAPHAVDVHGASSCIASYQSGQYTYYEVRLEHGFRNKEFEQMVVLIRVPTSPSDTDICTSVFRALNLNKSV